MYYVTNVLLRFLDKSDPNAHLIEKMILFILSISSILLSLTVGVTLLINPCFPPYLGSIILNCGSTDNTAWIGVQSTIGDIGLKWTLALIGSWFYAMCSSNVMVQLLTLYVTTGCLNSYLNQLYQFVLSKYLFKNLLLPNYI